MATYYTHLKHFTAGGELRAVNDMSEERLAHLRTLFPDLRPLGPGFVFTSEEKEMPLQQSFRRLMREVQPQDGRDYGLVFLSPVDVAGRGDWFPEALRAKVTQVRELLGAEACPSRSW